MIFARLTGVTGAHSAQFRIAFHVTGKIQQFATSVMLDIT
jgi:hypothetical protein